MPSSEWLGSSRYMQSLIAFCATNCSRRNAVLVMVGDGWLDGSLWEVSARSRWNVFALVESASPQ